ncbi:MAG: PQQ-dependent sugar dehydrogenase [Wenzhouxiangella sp.]|nr:MAG: PQQ-dependent sugar dehydrogenase [Wenzhouxiangella sp.]
MPAKILFLVLLFALGLGQATQAFQVETLAEGLEHPWSIAFLPDGRMLVTERAGRLRVIEGGQLLAAPVAEVPDAYVAAQGGLMEVALDPDYADNGWIYLTLAHGDRRASATRLVRGRLEDMRWVENQVLFTAEPARNRPVHYGARLAFNNDGTLLLTLGDAFDFREQAQKLDSHTGSIVRLNRDGSVPADNPFVGKAGALPEIFSYGHRNPQGIVVDPESGLIWSHEHGPRGGDELNLIRPGENYGWPVATFGVDYSGARITPYTSRPGMVDPKIDWTPSIAPAGMTQYRGSLFEDWQGDLLVASLVERSIRRIRLDGESVVGDEKLPLELGMRLRDVAVGPDGAIYILTDQRDGKVLRVTP